MEAKFSIIECHDVKPNEKWFGVGQTLWGSRNTCAYNRIGLVSRDILT